MATGDPYYADEHVTLYHGDALEVLPELRSQSFGAVILDPPYAMSPVSTRGVDDGAAGASGSPVRLLSESAKEAQRLLLPGGVAAVLCDWRRVPDVSYLLTLHGLRLSSCVAWTRTSIGTGGFFRSAWDPILIASVGQPNAIDRAGIPNIITANPPRNREHPYEKPPAIWRHVLQRIPTGRVIDPYAGSAASAAAALSTGHTWVGVEADERYCEDVRTQARPRRPRLHLTDGGTRMTTDLSGYDPRLIAALRNLGIAHGPETVWAAAMRLDFTTHSTTTNDD